MEDFNQNTSIEELNIGSFKKCHWHPILCLRYIKMMLALWNLSKLLTQRITQECINRNLTPVLNCESGNIASFKTALSVGFEIQQYYLHPDYKI